MKSEFLFLLKFGYILKTILAHQGTCIMPINSLHLGTLQQAVNTIIKQFSTDSIINRLWKKDHTIWRSEDEHKKSILNRLVCDVKTIILF